MTLLNPHFAIGTKDQEGSRIFYEPLAGWDGDGNLVPFLAAEIPSKENDGLAEDGRSVVWKLKRGVKWHDGKPFTADDVVFTWEYARNPETAAVSIAQLQGRQGRKDRRFHRSRHLRQADAVLGRCLCRHLRHDHPKASVCGLHRRQIARRAGQPEAGRHRRLTCSSISSRATSCWPSAIPTTTSPTGRISIRWKSRAAAMRYRPRARCCRPANMTTPGTCRWKTKSCTGWRAAGKGKVHHYAERQCRVHHAQLDRSVDRGGRRARQRQDQASAVQRPGGAPGHQPADRSRLDREVHLRPHRHRHRELPQQPGTLPVEKHQIRIQHRESQRRSSRPPAGRRAPTAFAPRTASR